MKITEITTVEGILSRCIAGLEQEQPVRKVMDPESAEKIDSFIQVLMDIKNLKNSFTIVSRRLCKSLKHKFNLIFSFLGYRRPLGEQLRRKS